MVSTEEKRAALHEKLQLLRSLTNSNAVRKSSIILDASKYIRELKEKVARLTQEITAANAAHDNEKINLLKPQVSVERAEKEGLLLIDVFSGGRRSCPAMLAAVLEALEELGLDVMEAKASCAHHAFRLVAVGRQDEGVDLQAVKEAVRRAIGDSEQEE